MSIHPMPSRSPREQALDESRQARFWRLRQQGMTVTEAWSHVRAQVSAAKPNQGRTPDDVLDSPVEHKVPNPQLTEWQAFRDAMPISLIILLAIWWILQQLFWFTLWLVGLFVRVVVGLLFFALGMIVGYRVFRDR